jgi:putative transposase
VKYACITRHRGQYPVRLMCRVLDITASGYYAARKREPAARAIDDALLGLRIEAIHRASRRRYGSPRVHEELRQGEGVRCGRKRVARLMRQRGLVARRPRRFRVTTQSRHGHPVAPNLVQRRFVVARRDRVWAGDITYVPTGEGWLYLAVLLDLHSRRVVGWAAGASLEQELVLRALRGALASRRPGPGLVHHSDRGSQYCCGAYRAVLAEHGILASMSRAGDCWDNAVAESFFATFKLELVAEAGWATRAEAIAAIGAFIEGWYNRQRRHSALGYLSPVAYELREMRQAA